MTSECEQFRSRKKQEKKAWKGYFENFWSHRSPRKRLAKECSRTNEKQKRASDDETKNIAGRVPETLQ